MLASSLGVESLMKLWEEERSMGRGWPLAELVLVRCMILIPCSAL